MRRWSGRTDLLDAAPTVRTVDGVLTGDGTMTGYIVVIALFALAILAAVLLVAFGDQVWQRRHPPGG